MTELFKAPFLPSAAEMREKMRNVLSEKDEKDLKQIAESIKRNYENGHIYWTTPASQIVKNKLSQAGYLLKETDNQHDGYFLTISWK